MNINSAVYDKALKEITAARAGWIGWGWYLWAKERIADKGELSRLRREFNNVSLLRSWAFRAGKDDAIKPLDPRFAKDVLGADAKELPRAETVQSEQLAGLRDARPWAG